MAWGDVVKNENKLDWTKMVSDNYLIYGESKSGKTFLAASKAKDILEKDATAKCYVVNTDMGFTETALQVGMDKFKDRIEYYYIKNVNDGIKVMTEISDKAKENDVLIFELVSWIWEESQKEFVNELSNGEVVGFIKRAMKDPKTFGTFAGLDWGYIKKVDDMISSKLTKNPTCKVIATTSVKDVSVDYQMNKKKDDIWLEIGAPAGRKDIMYEFANIIRIKKIDEKDAPAKRQFMVVGTRRKNLPYVWNDYTSAEDFWSKFEGLVK
jgi:hypothetical protein